MNSQSFDIFSVIGRIRIALGVEKDSQIAEKIGSKSSGLVSNWKKAGKVPDNALAQISEISGWSIQKLKTGIDDRDTSSNLDPATLQAVIEAVEEHLQANGLQLAPAKKAELITTLYEMFSEEEDKKVDKKTVAKLIRLAS